MTYEEAKEMKAALEAAVAEADAVMKQFPTLPNGLTPDAIRNTDVYRVAKFEYTKAFTTLQSFNAMFVKKFKKEYAAERKARDDQRREVAAMRRQK